LETRFVRNGNVFESGEMIIGCSTVSWREIWKYGPRGWRYTQLDVGHAIGSVLLSCNLHDYAVRVIDAFHVPNADNILGIHQINDRATKLNDKRELEQTVVFLLLTPERANKQETTNRLDSLQVVLTEVLSQDIPTPSNSHANSVFSRAEDPVIWPYIDSIERATHLIGSLPEPFSEETVLVDANLYSDKERLKKSIRIRRSALNFRAGKQISVQQMVSCFASVLPEMNPLVANHCQNFNGINNCRYYNNIHFGLWITGVSGIENGLYYLMRGESNEFLSQLNAQLNSCEVPKSLTRVKQPDIPKEMKLYRCADKQAREVSIIKKEASQNSCHQQIASDCSIVISMLAPITNLFNPRDYRYLHWEAGYLGHLLYIQAYQQQLGATGMGCFLDDESANIFATTRLMHPLYHFAIGPAEADSRFVSFV